MDKILAVGVLADAEEAVAPEVLWLTSIRFCLVPEAWDPPGGLIDFFLEDCVARSPFPAG